MFIQGAWYHAFSHRRWTPWGEDWAYLIVYFEEHAITHWTSSRSEADPEWFFSKPTIQVGMALSLVFGSMYISIDIEYVLLNFTFLYIVFGCIHIYSLICYCRTKRFLSAS